MKRLQVVLKAIMLRRTKETVIDGKPILELPARIVDVLACEFDDDERQFYSALEDKTTQTFEKLVMRGDVMKSYTSVLVLLLRLRQGTMITVARKPLTKFLAACNHPALIQKDYRKDAEALDTLPTKNDDDQLADLLAGLAVTNEQKCSICQTEYVRKPSLDRH
jgi:SNF2 family DNA or RNA helicase